MRIHHDTTLQAEFDLTNASLLTSFVRQEIVTYALDLKRLKTRQSAVIARIGEILLTLPEKREAKL